MKKIYSLNKILMFMALVLLGCKSDDVQLLEDTGLSGKYTGTWSSVTPTATFAGTSISAILELSGDRLSGEFFVSSTFSSCCGGINDGSLSMLVDGDQVTAFEYNDTIIDCSGYFSGTGFIREDGAIFINFTGSDCDGQHTDGLMLLNKQ